ncbi:MAG: AAA family ATPase [Carboxylicivirga sp.]|jgi:hypothetical protein|nr:AAA family ATPase [Carboxylicivirga sp.]
MGINWQKLKNNKKGKGFEDLAIEYLKNNFQGSWKQTKQTRDGNKDAVSIIYLNKEAWAEAKYTEKSRLPRFRLDATIVSAIIGKDKVVELIFITNSQIDITTKNSIKVALSNAMEKSFRVSFRTKEDIEFWLFNNPKVFEKYFSSTRDSLNSLKSQFDKIRFTSLVSFYKAIRQSISYNESLDSLVVGDIYIMLFSLFSPIEKEEISININSNKIVLLPESNNITVSKGENTISLKVKCIATGKINKQTPLITIDDCLHGTIAKNVLELKSSVILDISSQADILTDIYTSFNKFKDSLNSRCVHAIKGESGIGKTVLIEQLLKTGKFNNYNIIYQSFTNSSRDNQILLVNIVLSMLFYYLPPNEINEKYLKKITKENSFISSYILELVKARDASIENLALQMQRYSKYEELFPNMVDLNTRILILDDLHKLDEISREFLFSLITDINNSSLKCFVILVGRNQFWNNKEFIDFFRKSAFAFHDFDFTITDVFINLKKLGYDLDEKVLKHITARVKVNAIFTLKLIEYLDERKSLFKSLNLDAKHVIINQFVADGDYTNKILSSFNRLSEVQKELINIIYFSLSGIYKKDLNGHFDEVVSKDLSHLIKYHEGKFIPLHDIYQGIYKKHNAPISQNRLSKYLSSKPEDFEIIRNSLVFYNEDYNLNKVVEEIKLLEKTHQFYTILYILEPLFSELADIKKQKSNFPLSIMLQLQLIYTRSVTNCSKSQSGKDSFRALYEEIETIQNYNWDEGKVISDVLGNVIGELINSSFEHLQFSKVEEYAQKYDVSLRNAVNEGYFDSANIHRNPGFFLVREIEFLTSLAIDDFNEYQKKLSRLIALCEQANNFDKIDILKIRFARSIIHKDSKVAYQHLQEAIVSLSSRKSNETKWVLLGGFEKDFVEFQEGKCQTTKNIVLSHQKLRKNFFNDYRKAYLVLAACYLSLGMKEKTYDYLHQDFFIEREMRPRLKGFHLHLLALYESYFNNNNDLAKEYLTSQKEIFASLGESYHKVIDNNLRAISKPTPDMLVTFFREDSNTQDALIIDPRLW